MEVRVLEYFLAVAREESISGAAKTLHLTQPTLSRQLKDLEEELGKQLFIRGRRITLTEDGVLLRKRAGEIIDLVQKTEKDVMQNDRAIGGDIYIGAAETRGMQLILSAAAKMQQKYPAVKFHISSGDRKISVTGWTEGWMTLCFSWAGSMTAVMMPLNFRSGTGGA